MTTKIYLSKATRHLSKMFLLLLFLVSGISVSAQNALIPLVPSNGDTTRFGPIFRSSAASTTNFSRYAYIYSASELAAAGIQNGDQITAISWYKLSGFEMSSGRTGTFSIRLANSSNTSYSSPTAWSTLTSGSSVVYSNSSYNPGTATGWIQVNLSSSFTYTGGSLEVFTDWAVNSGSGNPSTGKFNWRTSSASGVSLGVSATTVGGVANLSTTFGNNRPDAKFEFTASGVCTDPPTAGSAISTALTVCNSGVNFGLSLSGNTFGTGQTYQWQISTDNSSWSDISGATDFQHVATQTTANYYRCNVTCGVSTIASSSVHVGFLESLNCYCGNPVSAASCSGGTMEDFIISNTTLSNTGTGCASLTGISYSQYPASGNTTATLTPGNTYTFSSSSNTAGRRIAMWIDWDRNAVYDTTEFYIITNSTVANTLYSLNVTVPMTAQGGTTGIRLRNRGLTWSNTEACTVLGGGEAEDYLITIDNSVCSGTPTPGTATSTASSLCPGYSFTLDLTGYSTSTGITFQWQISPDNSTWSDISGATGLTYTGSQYSSNYYRCAVSCGVNTAYSNVLSITNDLSLSCYCTTSLHTGTACSGGRIESFIIGNTTLDNSASGCGSLTSTSYSQYPASGNTTATITPGNTYNFTASSNTGTRRIAMWIDWDRNSVYDSTEFYSIVSSTLANTPYTISVVVPLTAQGGVTGVRVRARSTTILSTNACTSFNNGETEDYLITIDNTPCSGSPVAGTVTASVDSICPGGSITLDLNGYSTSTGITFQWQSSSDNINWDDISGATGLTYTGINSATTYYRCSVACGVNTALSNTVTITNIVSSDCYCTTNLVTVAGCSGGSITDFSISGTTLNNAASGCAGLNGNSYSQYAPSGSNTGNLTVGDTYTFSSTVNANTRRIAVWIDWDRNSVYDTNEFYSITTSTVSNVASTISIQVPLTATPGMTGVRVRSRSAAFTSSDACTSIGTGETEDYIITIDPIPNCSGTPTAGTVSASVFTICENTSFTLTNTGYTVAAGITFQWQSSADNATWSNITGATNTTHTLFQSSASYYQCVVSCGSNDAVTNSVFVDLTDFLTCYCSPTYTIGCATYAIDSFSIQGTTMSNTGTGCTNLNALGYSVYAPSGNTTASLEKTTQYTFEFTTTASSYVRFWIDWNQNGTYESSESYLVSAATVANTPSTYIVTVPGTADTGVTGMRIRTRVANNSMSATDACTSYGSGEAEDYQITIMDPPTCTNPPASGSISGSTSVIPGPPDNTYTVSGYTGDYLQWQVSTGTSATGTYSTISGATNATLNHQFNSIVNTTRHFRVIHSSPGCTNDTTGPYAVSITRRPGDTYATAISIGTISSSYVITDSTNNASGYSSAYTGTNAQSSADVFYTFTTGPCASTLDITTCDAFTSYNTYIHLLDNTGNWLVSNNDDAGCSFNANRSTISGYAVSPNTTYTLVVEGNTSSEGKFEATITVNNTLPTVSFSGLPASACNSDGISALSGSPSGGTFSGPGITGNDFDPFTAGVGTHSITYSYTNGNGCSNSSTQNVTVTDGTVTSFPYDNTFANSNCWSTQSMVGSGSWALNSNATISGLNPQSDASWKITCANNGDRTRLISPIFDLTTVPNPLLLLDVARDDQVTGQNDTLWILTSTDGGSNWSYFRYVVRVSTSIQWAVMQRLLDGFGGSSNFRLAFEAVSLGSGRELAIDKIRIEEATCAPAANLSTTLNNNFATFNWTIDPSVTNYDIRYGTSTSGPWTYVNSVTPPYTTPALYVNTTYYWQVRSTCAGPYSNGWPTNFQSFTTNNPAPNCVRPFNLSNSPVNTTSQNVAWDNSVTSNTYTIQYWRFDGITWLGPYFKSMNYNGINNTDLTGLVAAGNYRWRVRSNCTSSPSSTYSVYNTFMAGFRYANPDLPGVDENPWSVYPNPAQKQVSVKFFTDKAEEYTITIADLSGKTVQVNNGTTSEDETIVSLNLENLSSGVYFLTLKTDGVSKTDKLVIQ